MGKFKSRRATNGRSIADQGRRALTAEARRAGGQGTIPPASRADQHRAIPNHPHHERHTPRNAASSHVAAETGPATIDSHPPAPSPHTASQDGGGER